MNCFFKDTQGLMWIGTNNGINAFDGEQVTSYVNRFPVKSNLIINSIVENSDRSFWLGAETGLYRYWRLNNKFEPVKLPGNNIAIKDIINNGKGKIFFASNQGIFFLNSHDKVQHDNSPIRLNAQVGTVNDLIMGTNGSILAATSLGLFSILPSGKVSKSPLPFTNLRSLSSVGNKLFIVSDQTLYSITLNTGQYQVVPQFKDMPVNTLTSDGKQTLFVGTAGNGVASLNIETGMTQYFTYDKWNVNTISSNTIRSLYYGNDKTLWVGTLFEGFNYFTPTPPLRKFSLFPIKNSSGSETKIYVRSFFRDIDNTIYIGSPQGLYIVKNGIIAKQLPKGGLIGGSITTITPFPGNNDLLLIGTYGSGALTLSKKTLTLSKFSTNKNFQSSAVYSFSPDNKGNLWIGTLNGLYQYSLTSKILTRQDISKAMGTNMVYFAKTDLQNRVWVGTVNGLYLFDPNRKLIRQSPDMKKFRTQIVSINNDQEGNMWVGTVQYGVRCFNSNLSEIAKYDITNGLSKNDVTCIIDDHIGNIWISNDKGVFIINKKHKSIRRIDIWDGLPSLTFNPNAVTLDENGIIWWGNEVGLIRFNPQKLQYNHQIPNVILTNVFVNDHMINADSFLTANESQKSIYKVVIKGKSNNNLKFRAAALNYLNTPNNLYSFNLKGYDTEWSIPSTDNAITYNNLDAGSYTLRIKASNNDGLWNNTPVEIEVKIVPYFYESKWFIFIIILIIGGTIFYFTRNYIETVKDKIVAQYEEKKKQNTTIKSAKIAENKIEELKNKLAKYMTEDKPYLNPSLKSADVAAVLNLQVYEFSQFLNTYMNQNFSEYINNLRVEEVKSKIAQDRGRLKLVTIGMDCGFNSKTSFYRAFKKATGISPAEYFKDIIPVEDEE